MAAAAPQGCMAKYSVGVTTFCPGYIDSELTESLSHRVPNRVPMRSAVAAMKCALAKGDVLKVIDFRWSPIALTPMMPSNLIQILNPLVFSIFASGKNDLKNNSILERRPEDAPLDPANRE